jgi:hypothetical protein
MAIAEVTVFRHHDPTVGIRTRRDIAIGRSVAVCEVDRVERVVPRAGQ